MEPYYILIDKMEKAAEVRAKELGHTLGYWESGCMKYFTECKHCGLSAYVDSRVFWGRVFEDKCKGKS